MVDDQLEIEVDKICEYQRKHDTLAFLQKNATFLFRVSIAYQQRISKM